MQKRRCWIVVVVSLTLCQHASAQITFNTPANGNAVAFHMIPEDTTTTAITAENLIADGGTYPYSYTIVSQDGDATDGNILFEIDTATVKTKTTATFDYETKSSYVLIIQAVDSAPIQATASATLTVPISDVNDAPIWPAYRMIGCIAEDSVADDSVIGTFTTTDPDTTSPNNEIDFYYITGGNSDAHFDVDITTGVITRTNIALDINNQNWYELQYEAVDRGTPAMTATTTVYIAVGSPICCGTGSLRGNFYCQSFVGVCLVIARLINAI